MPTLDTDLRSLFAWAAALLGVLVLAALAVRYLHAGQAASPTPTGEEPGLPADVRAHLADLDLDPAQRRVVAAYARARTALAREGRRPSPDQTPSEFVHTLPHPEAGPVGELTDLYLATVHGDRSPSRDQVARARHLAERTTEGGDR